MKEAFKKRVWDFSVFILATLGVIVMLFVLTYDSNKLEETESFCRGIHSDFSVFADWDVNIAILESTREIFVDVDLFCGEDFNLVEFDCNVEGWNVCFRCEPNKKEELE